MKNFTWYCQKVLPLVYDESLSYYEQICKILHYLKGLSDDVEKIVKEFDITKTELNGLKKDLNYLSGEIEKVKNGDYVSLYLDSLINWIDKNIQELVARIVKYVFFGLSDDGYFIATIPESWDFLEFDTIMTEENYGHLKLSW